MSEGVKHTFVIFV